MGDPSADPLNPGFDPTTMGGWIPDAESRPAIQASMPHLKQFAPFLAADRSKSVLLYKCWKEIFRDYPDYPAQQIGDCVSFGHAHAHDLLMTCLVYLGELPEEAVGRTCTEALYGAGRAAGNMLGSFDGCYGSAMLLACKQAGCLRYSDLPAGQQEYSGQRAKEWGRTGMPAEYNAIAANRRLQGAMVDSAHEMLAALQGGSPGTICTAHGFSMQRDARGFCKMQGRWGHCMGVAGYRADYQGFLIIQSWGPHQPSGPLDLDQPSWSFWCTWEAMDLICRERDSNALSGTPGFLRRSLPWTLTHP